MLAAMNPFKVLTKNFSKMYRLILVSILVHTPPGTLLSVLYGGVTAYQSSNSWSDESAYSAYPGYSGSQGGGLSKSIWYAHYGDGGADKLFGGGWV